MKKTLLNGKKRIKKHKVEVKQTKYVEVKRKSRAGVEYIKFVLVIPALPAGHNHSSWRQLKAKTKRS